MADSVMVVLRRKQTIEWVRRFVRHFSPTSFLDAKGRSRSVNDFWQVIENPRGLNDDVQEWQLVGPSRIQAEHGSVDDVHRLGQLAGTYEWSLIPWGYDATAQMLAFVSANDAIWACANTCLRDADCLGFVVSTYHHKGISEETFHGVVFARDVSSRGEGILPNPADDAALVLTCNTRVLPECAEVVEEGEEESLGQRFRTRWVRIHDESALCSFAKDWLPALITAADISPDARTYAVWHCNEVMGDPLFFGIKAVKSASWLYVPKTEYEEREIFVHKTPGIAAKLMCSDKLLHAPYFSALCYF